MKLLNPNNYQIIRIGRIGSEIFVWDRQNRQTFLRRDRQDRQLKLVILTTNTEARPKQNLEKGRTPTNSEYVNGKIITTDF